MQHLGRKSAMNNGKFGTWTSECFVVLITEWEMISPWSLILWLTLHICSSALVCLQQKTIEKKMINSSLIGFFPLWWEQSGWPQRLNVLIGGESLPVFILSVTGTRQPRCFRSLHNQGWLVLACTLYSYGISVLAADPHLPARLWSLKTFLLWLSTLFLVGELACCWVRGPWLVPLPSVPGPFLWWNCGAPGTHRHKNLTTSPTQSGPLIPTVCLSICPSPV